MRRRIDIATLGKYTDLRADSAECYYECLEANNVFRMELDTYLAHLEVADAEADKDSELEICLREVDTVGSCF